MVSASDLLAASRSVVAQDVGGVGPIGGTPYPWLLAALYGNAVPAWGSDIQGRDIALQGFLTTEPLAAGAVATISARNAAFSWEVSADSDALRDATVDILRGADMGRGWEHFAMGVGRDYISQDKGAFVEVIRAADSPTAPLIGLQCLPARDCWPTGRLDEPVVYRDRFGKVHRLKWYQVYRLQELPWPHPTVDGLQFCAVSRFLRAAQIHLNIITYIEEKTGGRRSRAMHLVSGVAPQELQSAVAKLTMEADNEGLTRYQPPVIIPALSDRERVEVATLELAALPDGFDVESNMKTYLTTLALALLCDFQEIAPLPSGNIGTGAQSETLDQKSRQKGAALWRKAIDNMMTDILPKGVEFRFTEVDVDEANLQATGMKTRAEAIKIYTETGALDADGARALAVEHGDIPIEIADEVAKRAAEEAAEPPEEIIPPELLGAGVGEPAAGGPSTGTQVSPESVSASSDETKGAKAAPVSAERMALEDDATALFERRLESVFARIRRAAEE